MAEENENDVKRGREILPTWKLRIEALPFPGFVPGVDLRLAGLGALATFRRVEALGLLPQLRLLAAEVFDLSAIDDTLDGALALLAAERDLSGWTPPSTSIPVDVVEECTTLRGEMAEVLRYALVDEEALKRVDRVMRGKGFVDLYTDLAEFSEMYEEFAEELEEGGGRRYRAADGERAAKLSTKLMKLLTEPFAGAPSPVVTAYKVYALVETALQELVDGVWILRRKVDRKPWPTLRSLSRRQRRAKKVGEAAVAGPSGPG